MATTETKYQTNFYSAKNTSIKPNFNKGFLKIPIKYQENTKKIPRNLGQKYQIPISYWYFLGIPNSWFPIDIITSDGIQPPPSPEIRRRPADSSVTRRRRSGSPGRTGRRSGERLQRRRWRRQERAAPFQSGGVRLRPGGPGVGRRWRGAVGAGVWVRRILWVLPLPLLLLLLLLLVLRVGAVFRVALLGVVRELVVAV